MPGSRRSDALRLAEEILTDIELARVPGVDVARKTSRLARLLDDAEALGWLRFEIAGYPTVDTGGLTTVATVAADRSNRLASVGEEGNRYWTASLAALQAEVDGARAALDRSGGGVSGEWSMAVENARQKERSSLRAVMANRSALIDAIVGSFHDYVSARYQELRFGGAVETAFEAVRAEVDGAIASLVPDALPKLTAAFENTASDNPEDWASAAATCRRLLKAAADALRPAGPPKQGRAMDDEHYVNRLVDWIAEQTTSDTLAAMMSSDLEYLGRRSGRSADRGASGRPC